MARCLRRKFPLALTLILSIVCLILWNLPPPVECTISRAFSQFLTRTYGAEAERLIARRDIGWEGSFGGGKRREKARKRPVIFVHGLSNWAGMHDSTRRHFRCRGYRDSELYATTYSCGLQNWLLDRLECRHVKQIRLLIKAVSRYTRSQVDVIGHSMGSPLSRKAILGGQCVDTGEFVGPPLSHLVHTFMGVAGANRDAVHLCNLFFWAAPCNKLNGISCCSTFLNDVNSRVGYEASARIFVVRSVDDNIVGNVACDGSLVSTIPGQQREIVFRGYNHHMVIFGTAEEQYRLLNGAC